MAASQDSLQFGIVKQTNPEVVPTTPAFDLFRITSESLDFAYDTTLSDEIGGGTRGISDNIVQSAAVSGTMSFELASSKALELLLAAHCMSDWGDDPLTVTITANDVYVASTITPYLIEKRFTLDDGSFVFHRYLGSVMNGLSLSITPGSPITGSFDVIGNSLVTDTAIITGATYAAAGTAPVMTAPLVTGITLRDKDGDPVFEVGTHCWTSLDLTLTNNARALQCIGKLGARESVIAKYEGTISYSILLTNNWMLETLKSQDKVALEITMADSAGKTYKFTFPRLKITSAAAPASGSDDDLIVTGEMVVLAGDVSPKVYPLMITRSAAATFDAPVAPVRKKEAEPA